MKFVASHVLAILAAFLMLGGVVFWPLVGVSVYEYYTEVYVANVATPTPTEPTYEPIPTVPGQAITPVAVPTELPTSVPPTDTPTAVPTQAPTAVPTEIPTATPIDTPTAQATASAVPTATVEVVACPTEKQVLTVAGTTELPVASALALLYDGRYVGGGTIKPGGVFSIPLAKAPRVPGTHQIAVVLRGTETRVKPVTLLTMSCTIA
jgi:uncharacterized membrane protein